MFLLVRVHTEQVVPVVRKRFNKQIWTGLSALGGGAAVPSERWSVLRIPMRRYVGGE
jgi:hypothetical protein